MPHVFASQIEYIHKHISYRDHITLSVHNHNDRGTGVATSELAVLAGADRVEGTLFGNGERTGNVDLMTLALNLYSHGIDPGLDFSDINRIAARYENLTRMQVEPRHPYAGQLVFTAFSGSHQDAIAKGFAWHDKGKDKGLWTVPYLPIDPADIGRTYDGDVIRINSQSGKGGVSYILRTNFGIVLPRAMQEEVGYLVKDISDKEHAELEPARIYRIFEDSYVHNHTQFHLEDCHFRRENGIVATVVLETDRQRFEVEASGSGRLDAVNHCIMQHFGLEYRLSVYEEHALGEGADARAVTYVSLVSDGQTFWGVGIHADIIQSSIDALVSAVNRMMMLQSHTTDRQDERIQQIMSYIRQNYRTVTLDDLSREFFLSKPYLSRYIRDKSGLTFGGNVQKIRLGKAGSMLRSGNMKVERIAESVGYPNVEHFNRLFKKTFGCTPVQYRAAGNTQEGSGK